MTISERLREFIKSEKLSVCEFERMISAGNGYVSRIRNSIKPGRLELISLKFPQLNLNWLLHGEGEMLLKPNLHESAGTYTALPARKKTAEDKTTENLKHIIRALEQDIGHQQQTIDYYRKLVNDLSK